MLVTKEEIDTRNYVIQRINFLDSLIGYVYELKNDDIYYSCSIRAVSCSLPRMININYEKAEDVLFLEEENGLGTFHDQVFTFPASHGYEAVQVKYYMKDREPVDKIRDAVKISATGSKQIFTFTKNQIGKALGLYLRSYTGSGNCHVRQNFDFIPYDGIKIQVVIVPNGSSNNEYRHQFKRI